ncbi:hypothetical protein RvY_10956 [Ramazzottius varieornatus]|uniref:Uncharacterized protein n=1 Tax=Ramazzottius varieornatus TaxID=947166 RepID=A0A1D1VJY3_RAMVA|nr:hypothetical protein RvY_10956 [Ramazzottius varieornatus]
MAVHQLIAITLLFNGMFCNGLWLSRSWIIPNTTPVAGDVQQATPAVPVEKKIPMHNVDLEHLRRLAERVFGGSRPSQPFGRPRFR